MSEPINFAELDMMAQVVREEGTNPDGRWAAYAGRVLGLPAWFDMTLDPDAAPYRAQQVRLWQAIAGTQGGYDALRDEQAAEIGDFDPVRFPAFYARRDPAVVTSAADHLIALGNLIKLSGLRPGDTAIEYGAGFGQTALALARLGVSVDAVDINRMFNDAIRAQAEHFGVPLRAVHGRFGDNPRPGGQYDAVLFYEAFHHCEEPLALIAQLRRLVKPGGVVLMAGEPICPPCDIVPYPWGMRLDAETVAVVRWRHWFEVGFQEDYLVRAFIAAGFVWRKYPCALTHYGEVHTFRPRPDRIAMADYAMPAADAAGWHGCEPAGRWTAGRAGIPIDAGTTHTHIRVALTNYLPHPIECSVGCGAAVQPMQLATLEGVIVTIPRPVGARMVDIVAEARTAPGDDRVFGVFVSWFEYASPGVGGAQVAPLAAGD